jgi:hypothetical protein
MPHTHTPHTTLTRCEVNLFWPNANCRSSVFLFRVYGEKTGDLFENVGYVDVRGHSRLQSVG